MQAAPTVSQGSRAGATASRHAARRVDPLAVEVLVALAVKLSAILLIWLAFFRPGDAPVPSPDARSVAQHIAAPTPPPEVSVADH